MEINVKITIAIATYNRKKELYKTLTSLSKVEGIEGCNVRIYDDRTNEFDINTIKDDFKFIKEIKIREKNLGADENMYQMYHDFLLTKDDIFFQADSDLIFDKKCISIIKTYISKTDGLMSVLNSKAHKYTNENEFFIEKKTIGGAGAVFTRNTLEEILNNVKKSECYDWSFSYYWSTQKKIYVTKDSYVQHIGFNGQNSGNLCFDFGFNFKDNSETNISILNEVYREYFESIIYKTDSEIINIFLKKIIKKKILDILYIIFGKNLFLKILNFNGKLKKLKRKKITKDKS